MRNEKRIPPEFLGSIRGRIRPQDFEIESLPWELQCLTSQSLFDLFDQARKWGDSYEKMYKRIDAFYPKRRFGMCIIVNPYTRSMTIIRTNKNRVAEATEGVFLLNLKMGRVCWDCRITLDEVLAVRDACDDIAKKNKLINENGERLLNVSS